MKLVIDKLALEIPGLDPGDAERLASKIAGALGEAGRIGEGFRPPARTSVVLDHAEADLDLLAVRIAGALQREWR